MTSPNPELILQKFDLQPGGGTRVFGSDLNIAVFEIESNYRKSNYDHRPLLPGFATESPFYTEQYRAGYACFKREVAAVLRPKVIVEIGIGVGIGALAFMDACPSAKYHGIDNDEADFPVNPRIRPSAFVSEALANHGYEHQIHILNSQKIEELPVKWADLVHVDGDHSREAARHDTALAWRSGAKWILCDDARDSSVVAGIFDALSIDLDRGSVEWAYFPDTWTGSILIRTDHRRE